MVSSSSEQVAMKGNSPETARKIAPALILTLILNQTLTLTGGGEFSSGAIFRTP